MGYALPKLDEIPPSTGEFELLPAGEYHLGVAEVSDELIPTNAGGGMLKFKFEVIDGDRAGTPIWNNYNVEHADSETVRRAWADMSALGLATGVRGGEDVTTFLHKTFWAKIGVKPASKGKDGKDYKAQNTLAKYYPQGDAPRSAPPVASQATKAVAAPAAAAAAPAAVFGKPAPWRK